MTRMRAVLGGVALLVLATIEAVASEPWRVLLLHSSSYALSPWSNIAATFRAELVKRSPRPLDIHDISFDVLRYQGRPQEEGPFVEYLRALFSERKVDLVVPIGVPAATFLQRHRSLLFSTVPMLIVGAADGRIPDATLTPIDTAVATLIDIPSEIENILRLRPDTKDIVILGGQSPADQYWLSELRRHVRPFEERVNFVWLDSLPFDEMLRRAAALPEHAVIYLFLLSVDARGVPYSEDRALDLVRAVAAVPICGIGDYQVGRGIVGGPVVQSDAIGGRAAGVALRILGGEAPSEIKIPPVEFSSTYDWRELRRWGMAESLLPAGSVVRFREPGVWEQYRWLILLAAAAIVAQALLIAGLFYQRRQRRVAEVEARRRMGELALVNRRAAIGEMSASLAHEIKQPLSAIVMSGDAGVRWLARQPPNPEEAAAALKQIVADAYRANQLLESIRAMFKKDEQSRSLLDVNDVVREVLMLLRIELDEHDVTVRTALSDGAPRVMGNRIQLQQVVLNLARNAIDAMDAVGERSRLLKVASAATDADEFVVTIEDNGPGIVPDILDRLFEPFVTTKSGGMGMGLSICRSIVEAHGGRLSAAPAKPHGVRFEVVLPLPQ
jgi:signal transduction histidine kinase/ABC-type uncharacterized transport system substrate-binding protein